MKVFEFVVVIAVCLLVWGAPAHAQGVKGKPKGLFAETEKEVIEYLAQGYRIPHFPRFGWAQPEPQSRPRYWKELDRALELYKGGSSELRLAIAKALSDVTRVPGFWNASSPDDFEPKHYLVGVGLQGKDEASRGERGCWELFFFRPRWGFGIFLFLTIGLLRKRAATRRGFAARKASRRF